MVRCVRRETLVPAPAAVPVAIAVDVVIEGLIATWITATWITATWITASWITASWITASWITATWITAMIVRLDRADRQRRSDQSCQQKQYPCPPRYPREDH